MRVTPHAVSWSTSWSETLGAIRGNLPSPSGYKSPGEPRAVDPDRDCGRAAAARRPRRAAAPPRAVARLPAPRPGAHDAREGRARAAPVLVRRRQFGAAVRSHAAQLDLRVGQAAAEHLRLRHRERPGAV